ncbi:uncharacterized protein BKA78DRAFT_294175 [Phyllosticta capitalensis]|uniref:uncharacterized protein n=1 Tax=Phyllosticta capitalensis TaxID=121624 RepID=UPI00312D5F86
MNRRRFRAADQAVAAGPASAQAHRNDENQRAGNNTTFSGRGLGQGRGFGQGRGRGRGRGGWTQTAANASFVGPACGEDRGSSLRGGGNRGRGRGGHHGRGGRGGQQGHGSQGRRRRNEKEQEKRAKDLDPLSAGLASAANHYIACHAECQELDGPFAVPWKIWDPRSEDDFRRRHLSPIFHGIKSTMKQWADISMHNWAMADNMVIWNVESVLRGSWYIEQNLPGAGEPVCIRPWFWMDEVESSELPVCLVKAWVSDEVVMISLSEGNEIPLSIWLDKLAARKRPDDIDEQTLWRYWMANDKKFNFAGLPVELKLHICSFLVSPQEIHPYERPATRGAIARGDADPEPQVAQGWQITEGLWWALPRLDRDGLRCPGLPPLNGLAADFLLATNVYSFDVPQSLKRFLDNMGSSIRGVRKLKLNFQYEDLLLLFGNGNQPLLTVPGDDDEDGAQRHRERKSTVKFFQNLLKRLQTLNITELKFHVRKTQRSFLSKNQHYGFVPWAFECHYRMQLYIFQLMVSHFFHVKNLGIVFDCVPEDALIYDELARIHAAAMNHPEGELKVARKIREEARLAEILGEEEEGDGGVRLPRRPPQFKNLLELGPRHPVLERAHDPVQWLLQSSEHSEVMFPCTAHPGDKCFGRSDCIFGLFTAGRRREGPEEYEPVTERQTIAFEEWKAAEAAREAKKSRDSSIDEEDEGEPSYPGPSPWLDREGLLDEEND